jgi:hypothetical protein
VPVRFNDAYLIKQIKTGLSIYRTHSQRAVVFVATSTYLLDKFADAIRVHIDAFGQSKIIDLYNSWLA